MKFLGTALLFVASTVANGEVIFYDDKAEFMAAIDALKPGALTHRSVATSPWSATPRGLPYKSGDVTFLSNPTQENNPQSPPMFSLAPPQIGTSNFGDIPIYYFVTPNLEQLEGMTIQMDQPFFAMGFDAAYYAGGMFDLGIKIFDDTVRTYSGTNVHPHGPTGQDPPKFYGFINTDEVNDPQTTTFELGAGSGAQLAFMADTFVYSITHDDTVRSLSLSLLFKQAQNDVI